MNVPPGAVVLLAAVEAEIEPLRRRLGRTRLGLETHFVVSGAGKANAASAAALALAARPARLLLQVGCAGAFPSSGLVPGDVVLATEEVLADEGVEAEEGFLDLRALGLGASLGGTMVHNEVPASRLLPGELDALRAEAGGRFRLAAGRLVTVSTGSGTEARSRTLEERWQPLAESMEGGAAALAALRQGCPFVEVRGISNFTGRRDRASWKLEAACDHAAIIAARLLELRAARPPGADEAPR